MWCLSWIWLRHTIKCPSPLLFECFRASTFQDGEFSRSIGLLLAHGTLSLLMTLVIGSSSLKAVEAM